MARIKKVQLQDETIYPVTHVEAVYDDDGNKLSDILKDGIMQGPQGEPGKSISIVLLTQEEYEALDVKDDYTFYGIKED